MELEEFRAYMAQRRPILPGSEIQQFMSALCRETRRQTAELNSGYHEPEEIGRLFAAIIGREPGEGFSLFPPFYTDFGKNITVGDHVFLNACCRFQDQGGITIGDGTLIGHGVTLATLNHDENPERRAVLYPAPIQIGRRVWIGSGATVLPGVTIGDGAIVAAGAVVTRDVPPETVVAGVPARLLRPIRKADAFASG